MPFDDFFANQAPEPEPAPRPAGPELYARPSRKQPDTAIVVGVRTAEGEDKRIVLLRLEDDGETVKLRALSGNPRERSSTANTQAVARVAVADLTPDQ